jgi:Lrp/AsnC family transcriptional regulator
LPFCERSDADGGSARLLADGGEYDYLLRVQVADMKRYDDFYKRLVNSVPGLSDVTSSFAMEQIKYTTALPVE